MIRTTLSYCLLFVALLLGSKWLHDSRQATQATPAPEGKTSEAQPASAEPRQDVVVHDALFITEEGDECIQLTTLEDDLLDEVLDNLRPAPLLAPLLNVPDRGCDNESCCEIKEPGTKIPKVEHTAQTAPQNVSTAESTAEHDADQYTDEIEMTPELIELRRKLRECLAYYYFRPENVALRSPWGAMHAMIAYGVDSELIVGDKRLNAIGYLCYNGVCNGQQLFYLSNGKLQARIGPGVQGHPGQFLAMLAQSRVKPNFPIRVDNKNFTVADLIQYEKDNCRPRTELTFKLISFTHYLDLDDKWKSNDGQDWDIQRVIKEELAQPIIGAACGGSHRLTGFSYAMRKREARGLKFDGQWQRAKTFIEDYHEYAFKLQNPDGSFSTDWFRGRADFGPPSKRLETTGHVTEWLAFSLTKEQLVEPRTVKSVKYLTNLLLDNRNEKWGIGPLGHGLHALAMYDERIFGGQPGTRAVELAEVRKSRKSVER